MGGGGVAIAPVDGHVGSYYPEDYRLVCSSRPPGGDKRPGDQRRVLSLRKRVS